MVGYQAVGTFIFLSFWCHLFVLPCFLFWGSGCAAFRAMFRAVPLKLVREPHQKVKH
jgi:hypothetical protein